MCSFSMPLQLVLPTSWAKWTRSRHRPPEAGFLPWKLASLPCLAESLLLKNKYHSGIKMQMILKTTFGRIPLDLWVCPKRLRVKMGSLWKPSSNIHSSFSAALAVERAPRMPEKPPQPGTVPRPLFARLLDCKD